MNPIPKCFWGIAMAAVAAPLLVLASCGGDPPVDGHTPSQASTAATSAGAYKSPSGDLSFRWNQDKYFLEEDAAESPLFAPLVADADVAVALVQREEPESLAAIATVLITSIPGDREAAGYEEASEDPWLQSVLAGFMEQARENNPDVEILDYGLRDIDGQPGIAFESSALVDGVQRHWLFCQAWAPEAAYTVICAAPESDWEARVADFESIVESIRLD